MAEEFERDEHDLEDDDDEAGLDDDAFFDPVDQLTRGMPHAAGIGPLGPLEHELLDPFAPATMICARGPCKHLFGCSMRLRRTESLLTVYQASSCTAGLREMDLTDQSVYRCSRWQPWQASLVPTVLWATLGPALTLIYEAWLRHVGAPAWLVKLDELAADRRETRSVWHRLKRVIRTPGVEGGAR